MAATSSDSATASVKPPRGRASRQSDDDGTSTTSRRAVTFDRFSRQLRILATIALAATAPIASAQTARFEGNWWNTDPTSRGIVRLEVALRGENVFVAAWGACLPEPCLIGREFATAFASSIADDPVDSAEVLTIEYTTPFGRNIVTLRREGDGLASESFTLFTDGSQRSAYVQRGTFMLREARRPRSLEPVQREPLVISPTPDRTRDPTQQIDADAERTIQPDGSVRIGHPDGTTIIRSIGSRTIIHPDGSTTQIMFLEVPMIPPPTTSATAHWFEFAAGVTERTIRMLVEGDPLSLANLIASEDGLNVSEVVTKRMQMIEWLLP